MCIRDRVPTYGAVDAFGLGKRAGLDAQEAVLVEVQHVGAFQRWVSSGGGGAPEPEVQPRRAAGTPQYSTLNM